MAENTNKFLVDRFMSPIKTFMHRETSAGILLILCTVIALVWANSPLAESYFSLWHTHIMFDIAGYSLDYSLHHWINDGLMAVFFFVVGLEIKREFLVGELSTAKQAALPVAAALGGMIVPALIFLVFNFGTENAAGWGVPMATDIAFVVGIMALLGKAVPLSLKIFITALAIADDIGAVLVIAIFYTSDISLISLGIGGAVLLTLIIINKMGVRNLLIYTILGLILWLAFLKSGVHATVAGVILAFTIPAFTRINTRGFLDSGRILLDDFDDAGEEGPDVLTNDRRQQIVQSLEENCEKILTPLQRFEHGLHPWVSFFIMPVFALANAGVSLSGDIGGALIHPVSLGIIGGLFIGKQIGIFAFTWMAVKFGISELPAMVNWKKIYAAGLLAGIGFTMSLFIANLAFTDPEILNISKIGILTASIISGVAGFIMMKIGYRAMQKMNQKLDS